MISFTSRFISASDGTKLRTAVLDAGPKARGVCVLLQGRAEFIEKYGEVTSELLARGLTVATFDWRGQGGSARPLCDPLKSHVGDFSEYDDDLASFISEIVGPLTSKPPLALAHSMGAHVLLRALHHRPGALAAAVLVSPMLDIATRDFPAPLMRLVTALHNVCGLANEFAWDTMARDPFLITFDTQLVTSDRARFARAQEFLRQKPAIRSGGATWGWIEAAYRSLGTVTAPGYAEAIATPVLIVGAGRDRIVRTSAARAFARRLPRATYVELDRSEHEILMEADPFRARFWQAFDEFAGKVF